MEGYSFRPASLDDVHPVHQLISAQNILDYGDSLRSVEDIQRIWNSPSFDLELDTQLAIAPGGQIAAYAELRGKEDVFTYISSEYQDPKLAAHLLKFLEERARSLKSGTEPVELWGHAGFRNPLLIENFETHGYGSDISFLIMEVELTEAPPTPIWPHGISARTFVRGQDEQATYRTDEDAAEDKGYHAPLSFEKWTARMGMDKESFDPSIWFLACKEEEIAGVALNTFKAETQAAWVDHLSVRRAWRNQGIGRALLLHSFAEFFKRGIHTVKLSVDSKSLTNAPRLYESVGMKTVQKYHVYKKAI
jgi:GNAT superfamily N-acetyltransferase